MHTIHRCTWKSLQFFIIMIMMAWFMRVFQQNALSPSSVYSILPQCIRPHFLSCMCVFSFLFTAMHVKSLAFCVWEWRRYSIQYNMFMWGRRCVHTSARCVCIEVYYIKNNFHCWVSQSYEYCKKLDVLWKQKRFEVFYLWSIEQSVCASSSLTRITWFSFNVLCKNDSIIFE